MSSRWRRYLAVSLILVLASWLRYYRLHELPPGLFGDEVLETLLARDSLAHLSFPVYFPADFGGTHSVLVYLTLLARFITGDYPLTIRFVVATLGIITVPLVYVAVAAIFQLDADYAPRRHTFALVGALAYAITFPNILIQRYGLEVSIPALMAALIFWGLAHGWRTAQGRYYAIAGFALGSSLYTAYIARLLPVAVLMATVWFFIRATPAARQRHWRGHLLLGLTALLAFAPLGWFFFQHSDIFLSRSLVLTDTTLGHGFLNALRLFLDGAYRTLASLSLNGFGDTNARHNLPARAVFDAFLSLIFWIGLGHLLTHWRRLTTALIVSWAVGMLLPVILTMGLNPPHFTRMTGAMPAFAVVGALGALTFFDVIHRYQPHLARGLLVLGFGFSLGVSGYDYFVVWANRPELFDFYQVGDWEAASLAQERAQNEIVYLAPELLTRSERIIFDLLLTGTPARAIPGAGCPIYYDHPAQRVTYLSDVLRDPTNYGQLAALFPTGRETQVIMRQPAPGWPLYSIFEIPPGAAATPPPHATEVQFDSKLRLLGYALSTETVRPGATLTITLYWQALAAPLAEYHVFVHVHRPGEPQPTAQSDSQPCHGRYPTPRWAMGEQVQDTHMLTLPADFNVTTAEIAIGVYAWPAQERLTLSGAPSPDNRFYLPPVPVAP